MATDTTEELAFHGDVKIREKYLARVRKHREADELIQGTGWERGKGCAVGCTFHKYDHSRGPIEIGFPVRLMQLDDVIFEGLKNGDAQAWPERFLSAPKVGADLSLVWPKFAVWMLADKKHGVRQYTEEGSDQRKAVDRVAKLWRRVLRGESEESLREDFAAARAAAGAAAWAAAWAAAGDAAWAAAWAAAWDAAGDAAWAAAWAAAGAAAGAAAWAAAWAAAGDAAWAAFWVAAANKLEKLLKAAPVARGKAA